MSGWSLINALRPCAPCMQAHDLKESDLILNIFINGQIYHSAEWSVAQRIIDEVFGNLRGGGDSAMNSAGEGVTVEFTLSKGRANRIDALQNFDSYLHAAVNHQTGYGALKWLLPPGSAVFIDAAIAEHVWISDNPTPPDMDPHVISDPDLPRYHHVRSTLPMHAVRAAVEEFCRTGTGMRPSCIDWTPGDLSGRRLDVPDSRISAAYCDDPWCDNSEPGHPCH
ncbi:Imm1 family immunity protein [Streptomyces sp. RB17]|uniref:Imm1 family immunity protein n=1 Tax=Streptomyces sp. RB17 TaxID=2585197 RepID=UPI001296E628|nr:Imm1 family immunity protein [Streptomyces sp. RB17]